MLYNVAFIQASIFMFNVVDVASCGGFAPLVSIARLAGVYSISVIILVDGQPKGSVCLQRMRTVITMVRLVQLHPPVCYFRLNACSVHHMDRGWLWCYPLAKFCMQSNLNACGATAHSVKGQGTVCAGQIVGGCHHGCQININYQLPRHTCMVVSYRQHFQTQHAAC
ncbi:hypothetical protein COO60DRAFT_1043774 [Scenedesmus sp. NREL 46B-D3]|nr:hypothetical protein COO60DRAFT_1043774 [Scenedesmus sp. NREL 46B-D3]